MEYTYIVPFDEFVASDECFGHGDGLELDDMYAWLGSCHGWR